MMLVPCSCPPSGARHTSSPLGLSFFKEKGKILTLAQSLQPLCSPLSAWGSFLGQTCHCLRPFHVLPFAWNAVPCEAVCILTCFRSLLKGLLVSKVFPDLGLKIAKPPPLSFLYSSSLSHDNVSVLRAGIILISLIIPPTFQIGLDVGRMRVYPPGNS